MKVSAGGTRSVGRSPEGLRGWEDSSLFATTRSADKEEKGPRETIPMPRLLSCLILLALTAWNKPGASTRWNVLLYDVAGRKFLDLPGLNRPGIDTRMSALSGDGRWLAHVSSARGGTRRTDIHLYDRKEGKLVLVPKLNSAYMEVEPSLSHDGRLIA